MTTVKDIWRLLDSMAPFNIAEKWDNCGLQAGSIDWDVNGIMIGLDVSQPLIDAAAEKGADLVLTHHPMTLQPLRQFDFTTPVGSLIYTCAVNHISIISLHTNLDKAWGGLNDYFAHKIGLRDIGVLSPDEPLSKVSSSNLESSLGIGRVGSLTDALSAGEFAKTLKKVLGISNMRVTGDLNQFVQRIAICTGSGGGLIQDAVASGADVFITGDMKYHEARDVEQTGCVLMDVGHFASEHMSIDLLAEGLASALKNTGFSIDIHTFKKEKDPFIIV